MKKTDKKLFSYIAENNKVRYLPFRVGDLVVINDWGGQYESYRSAFKHFYGNADKPYYAYRHHQCSSILCNKKFRVTAMAEHCSFSSTIVCYLRDVTGAGCVMDADYLSPVKVYPLRRGESREIKLDKIKRIR